MHGEDDTCPSFGADTSADADGDAQVFSDSTMDVRVLRSCALISRRRERDDGNLVGNFELGRTFDLQLYAERGRQEDKRRIYFKRF